MQVNIGDVRLKQVDTFTYLELSSNEESKQDIEIDRRIRVTNDQRSDQNRSNEGIREDIGVKSILNTIDCTKLRWYGHARRMDPERYARKYLNWTLTSAGLLAQ